jgi:hypothetical protein
MSATLPTWFGKRKKIFSLGGTSRKISQPFRQHLKQNLKDQDALRWHTKNCCTVDR